MLSKTQTALYLWRYSIPAKKGFLLIFGNWFTGTGIAAFVTTPQLVAAAAQ